jgi:5-methylcytosine-specific restriction protein B
MNTADRSIRLLDAALRRRFAFIELLPDTEPLSGGRVGDLDLAAFLLELNRRIARLEGREKQIGHSFLLEDGQPVADAGRFAQAFRYEILPLLQEYAYEDFRELAEYLGTNLVDVEEQVVRQDVLDDVDELVRVLARHLTPRAAEPITEPGEVE